MPETHISEWARMNGIKLDPLNGSEDREGGTRALGSFVPGLSRETLSVFTPAEWERERNRLVIDAWARKATRQIRARSAGP